MSETTSPIEQLMRQIAADYDGLSRQLKLIARYVEQHRASLMLVRISDIAAACDVQPSAIVRFAQRFGFSGFSEMQDLFRQSYTEQALASPDYQQRIRKLVSSRDQAISAGDITREIVGASRAGLDELATGLDDAQLDAAVSLLQHADNIYVIGMRRSFPVAAYIAYALENTDKRVHLVSGIGGMHRQQMRSARQGDVAIAISFAPYARETQDCVKLAADNSARVLVITDSTLSPLARRADALLTITEGSAFAFRSLTSTICLCQALFIALAYRLELDLKDHLNPPGDEP
jgi:DNA-binding MurR/RpiR family transcriptional regulator